MARGGDAQTCREACTERSDRDCYNGCLEAGVDPVDCRERCANAESDQESNETTCEEGDTVQRGDTTYICVDGQWVESTD